MAHSKQSCRLCRCVITNENFTIIDSYAKEMLDVILVKQDLNNGSKVICGACSVKLFAAFEFKSSCLYTNNTIRTYTDCKTELALDIGDIYVKEIENKQLVGALEDRKVCRLCMELITDGFLSLQEINCDVFQSYIPEINLNFTRDPLVCKCCYNCVLTHSAFLEQCIKTHKEEAERESLALQSAVRVKNEGIEIKAGYEAEGDVLLKAGTLLVKLEGRESVSGVSRHYPEQEVTDGKHLKDSHSSEKLQDMTAREKKISENKIKCQNASEEKIYKCRDCDYQSNRKGNVVAHQLKHRDASEVYMYKCEECDYQTKRKRNLTFHQLKHKDISEVQMHKCDDCAFRTKYKKSLASHRLMHVDSSHTQMYKCEECDFQTKYKGSFAQHQQTHKDVSEVQMYKCDSCDYHTRLKSSLVHHKVMHNEATEALMYKCDNCDFRTKHKKNLPRHQLMHRDTSEVQMYKCGECDWQTVHRVSLTRHQLTHTDASKVQMYKCRECDWQTKHKMSLTRHQLRHMDASEVQMYKCDDCDYKTKYKGALATHRTRHRNALEGNATDVTMIQSTSELLSVNM